MKWFAKNKIVNSCILACCLFAAACIARIVWLMCGGDLSLVIATVGAVVLGARFASEAVRVGKALS